MRRATINVQRNKLSCPLKVSLGHPEWCHAVNMRR
jgi:hypothetical protein